MRSPTCGGSTSVSSKSPSTPIQRVTRPGWSELSRGWQSTSRPGIRPRQRSRRVVDDGLSAGAVARRLGVAVTTLRTWHQRYGLGPSQHVPGQHRRYTREDLDRLQVMRRLTAQGVAPAEAAAWAKRVPVPLESSPAADPGWAAAADFEPEGTARDG